MENALTKCFLPRRYFNSLQLPSMEGETVYSRLDDTTHGQVTLNLLTLFFDSELNRIGSDKMIKTLTILVS